MKASKDKLNDIQNKTGIRNHRFNRIYLTNQGREADDAADQPDHEDHEVHPSLSPLGRIVDGIMYCPIPDQIDLQLFNFTIKYSYYMIIIN